MALKPFLVITFSMVITFTTPRNVTHTLTFLRSTGNVSVTLWRDEVRRKQQQEF